jgi:uncharacterized membrane protein
MMMTTLMTTATITVLKALGACSPGGRAVVVVVVVVVVMDSVFGSSKKLRSYHDSMINLPFMESLVTMPHVCLIEFTSILSHVHGSPACVIQGTDWTTYIAD